MNVKMLSILFLCGSLFSCSGNLDKIQFNEASVGGSCNSANPENTAKMAANVVFQSNDLGQTWQDISAGLPEAIEVQRVYAEDGEIILITGSKMYRTQIGAEGLKWDKALTQSMDMLQEINISDVFRGKTGLYASSYEKGFFKEIPGTQTWMPLHHALKDKRVRCIMETTDGALYVGVESGLFKSIDGGGSWKKVHDKCVNSLVAANDAETVLICGTDEGLRRSVDGGENWDLVLTEDFAAWETKRIEGGIITITEGGHWEDADRSSRLRFSTDEGKTWKRLDEGFAQVPFMYDSEYNPKGTRRIQAIAQSGKHLFCSTNAGVFRSDNMGKSWEMVRPSDGKEVLELVVSGNQVYAVQVIGC